MPKLDTRGISGRVLNGRNPKYIKVFKLYQARMTQEFLRILNASFWTRAEGNIDSDIHGEPEAAKWKKLRPATRKVWKPMDMGLLSSYKLRKDYYEGKIQGKESVGVLSPEQRNTWQEAYNRQLAGNKSPEAKRLAKKAGWEAVKDIDPDREYVSLINIRTGRLVACTAPGQVVGARYYATADQRVTVALNKVNISLKAIPYADAVDAVRPIIPNNIDPWIEKAHEAIISEVKALYDDIKNSTKRSTKKTNRRNNNSRSRKK